MSEEAVIARLARIETELMTMREENRVLRTTLHEMIGRSLSEHSAAIARLAASYDQRRGGWLALATASAVIIVLLGGIGWLIERKVQITFQP